MNNTEREMHPEFVRHRESRIRGHRTLTTVTHNPNEYLPGEQAIIEIPKLNSDTVILPGTLKLLFDFDVSGTKSTFKNNLHRQLQSQLRIRAGGTEVYSNIAESVYSTYKDLWKTKSERANMQRLGVGIENWRKLISGDDTAIKTGTEPLKAAAKTADILGKEMCIPLDKILGDQGSYSPSAINTPFRYSIHLAPAKDVLVAQSGETLGTYKLSNVKLEYETITSPEMAAKGTESYANRSLPFEDVALFKNLPVKGSDTIFSENVHFPRSSLRAVVILFTKQGRDDSEEYVYPDIEGVKITVGGMPNQLYSMGYDKKYFYKEAKRLFGNGSDVDQNVTVYDFFKDKFALVVDLRSTPEPNLYRNGRNVDSTKNGVDIQITKKATADNLLAQIFLVSDGKADFMNRNFTGVTI